MSGRIRPRTVSVGERVRELGQERVGATPALSGRHRLNRLTDFPAARITGLQGEGPRMTIKLTQQDVAEWILVQRLRERYRAREGDARQLGSKPAPMVPDSALPGPSGQGGRITSVGPRKDSDIRSVRTLPRPPHRPYRTSFSRLRNLPAERRAFRAGPQRAHVGRPA